MSSAAVDVPPNKEAKLPLKPALFLAVARVVRGCLLVPVGVFGAGTGAGGDGGDRRERWGGQQLVGDIYDPFIKHK